MSNNNVKKSKICESCGRQMEYRKKWKNNWDSIKFCSDECRKNKNKEDYRTDILDLLKQRGSTKSICPSEVLALEQRTDKNLMEFVRRSARLLVAQDLIEITQNNKVVDPSEFKGPIRLRLK
jgi:hypothetical protein